MGGGGELGHVQAGLGDDGPGQLQTLPIHPCNDSARQFAIGVLGVDLLVSTFDITLYGCEKRCDEFLLLCCSCTCDTERPVLSVFDACMTSLAASDPCADNLAGRSKDRRVPKVMIRVPIVIASPFAPSGSRSPRPSATSSRSSKSSSSRNWRACRSSSPTSSSTTWSSTAMITDTLLSLVGTPWPRRLLQE